MSYFSSILSGPHIPAGFFVENYRAFSRRQNIELRPLTLFFGWNSSGKSALVRFLPLIAESIRNAGPPIWLAGDVGRGANWSELVCRATQRDVLRFGIRWEAPDAAQAEWEVQGDLQGRWQEMKSLQWQQAEAPQTITAENWIGLIPRATLTKGEINGPPPTLPLRLEAIANNVQWVSGIRSRLQRNVPYGGSAPPNLPPDGENAMMHIIAAHIRDQADPMIDFARIFFETLGEQLAFDNPVVGLWHVLLHPKAEPGMRVNICDTGEGYTQVLPILVALARACTGGPRLVCLEQPELHLHTHAQEVLAKMLVAAVQYQAKPHLLVETHSEVLLRSVQLAIAKKEIAPEMVRVYWIEARKDGTSDAVAVDFNEHGRPTNSALVGAFDEAIRLGQQLTKLHLAKAP